MNTKTEWTFDAEQGLIFLRRAGQLIPTLYRLERADWSDRFSAGFYVNNLDNRERYFVHVSRSPVAVEVRCSCKRHMRHGHCKHRDAVAGLVAEGRVELS